MSANRFYKYYIAYRLVVESRAAEQEAVLKVKSGAK
jgi:hypothetical protein